MIDLKKSFMKNKSRLVLAAYILWAAISLLLAKLHPDKYAAYFTDLPDNLKNISPFFLSFAYLVLFIPSITVTVFFAIYFLYDVVKDRVFK
ncbi:MAG: hypothetical protein NTX65_14300 [Ignavibacteriales bacterium]|nr:hypothetical protein [Ignavibacteriales bacterium]